MKRAVIFDNYEHTLRPLSLAQNAINFGINSAPEVWQQRMHELVEGLTGVEVIADDFLVCGFGDTNEAAIANHDQNLKAFLRRARERNLTLNSEKLKLRQSQVPFIGHLLS